MGYDSPTGRPHSGIKILGGTLPKHDDPVHLSCDRYEPRRPEQGCGAWAVPTLDYFQDKTEHIEVVGGRYTGYAEVRARGWERRKLRGGPVVSVLDDYAQ